MAKSFVVSYMWVYAYECMHVYTLKALLNGHTQYTPLLITHCCTAKGIYWRLEEEVCD